LKPEYSFDRDLSNDHETEDYSYAYKKPDGSKHAHWNFLPQRRSLATTNGITFVRLALELTKRPLELILAAFGIS
jgi:hypothetical protein